MADDTGSLTAEEFREAYTPDEMRTVTLDTDETDTTCHAYDGTTGEICGDGAVQQVEYKYDGDVQWQTMPFCERHRIDPE